jgi:hypothetical protein
MRKKTQEPKALHNAFTSDLEASTITLYLTKRRFAMKTQNDSTRLPEELNLDFYKNSKKIEGLLGSKLSSVVHQLRVLGPSLAREEAIFLDAKDRPSYEDPRFLDACSHVISDATNRLDELHNEILILLPSWNLSAAEEEGVELAEAKISYTCL